MTQAKENHKKIEELSKSLGADLYGIADVIAMRSDFFFPSYLTARMDRAVSLGIRLLDGVLEEIQGKPTRLYYHHYRQTNILLDHISLKVASFIQREGFQTLPIPASQIIDWEKQRGHLSHKEIAKQAGLGWIGRNNLLVNPQFGSRLRFASILTDMELSPDAVIFKDCEECEECLKVCPAGAIKKKKEDFDYTACFEKLRAFKREGLTGQHICGVCIKACK